MFNRRKINALKAGQHSDFEPFKDGTRVLKKGYKYTQNGTILETKTGQERPIPAKALA